MLGAEGCLMEKSDGFFFFFVWFDENIWIILRKIRDRWNMNLGKLIENLNSNDLTIRLALRRRGIFFFPPH